jgi:hypothetical protein
MTITARHRDSDDEVGAPLTRHDVRIDVSDAVGIPHAEVAATVIGPAHGGGTGILAVAFPGGAYSRGYWDIQWPGGYSQAEYHASRGWLFAAVDHLGIGESSRLEPSTLTIELMARASSAATEGLVSLLRAGSLADSLGPVKVPLIIGIGQSMGGCVSIVAQALCQPFDGLAVLGYSPAHFELPHPEGETSVEAAAQAGMDTTAAIAWIFHHDDEDPALRHEDLRGGFPFRTESVPPWGAAIPPVGLSLLNAGIVEKEAAEVTIPILIGAGDRDVCPDPWIEPATYRASRNVTLCVVERMAHMHNFANSRRELWHSVHRWGESLRCAS